MLKREAIVTKNRFQSIDYISTGSTVTRNSYLEITKKT